MQKNRVMLVADDIDVNRASFRAMFEEENAVLEAGDGNEKLKILEERKVDIVILDMCMPVKSGKQVLKQMKADPKLLDIPVIVKTVIGEERELEMLEMGAMQKMHFIFQPLIGIKDAFAMFQKQFPGFCERNFIPLPIEKPRLITSFQFLDMFCYGRLK